MKALLLAVFVLALAAPALAFDDVSYAVVNGDVYDWETLQPVGGALVAVNSTPARSMLAWPNYSFELPRGDYRIHATLTVNGSKLSADENVSLNSSEAFAVNLLLTPEYDDIPDLPDLSDDVSFGSSGYLLVIAAAAVVVACLLFRRKKEPSVARMSEISPLGASPAKLYYESELQVLASFVGQKGEATKKELCAELRLSEAKLDLMLAELERRGQVSVSGSGRGAMVRKI